MCDSRPVTRHLRRSGAGSRDCWLRRAVLSGDVPKPVIEIDGANFWTLDGFYDEIQKKLLTPGVFWGRNLNAFNDILRGGFGTPEDGFVLRWRHSDLSRRRLADDTARWLEGMLAGCHPTQRRKVADRLAAVRNGQGENLFDTLVEIIRYHGPGGEEAEDGVDLELL
jgi:hypothetical protein